MKRDESAAPSRSRLFITRACLKRRRRRCCRWQVETSAKTSISTFLHNAPHERWKVGFSIPMDDPLRMNRWSSRLNLRMQTKLKQCMQQQTLKVASAFQCSKDSKERCAVTNTRIVAKPKG